MEDYVLHQIQELRELYDQAILSPEGTYSKNNLSVTPTVGVLFISVLAIVVKREATSRLRTSLLSELQQCKYNILLMSNIENYYSFLMKLMCQSVARYSGVQNTI
jgi:hypothetical protein